MVSAGATNSLIRQLLQTSPQFSHLLSDLDPVSAGGTPGPVDGKSTGSPKSALRGGAWTDGRSLPDTPSTSCRSAAVSRRLINRYVNVDEDSGRSKQQQRGNRDRPRPSTAPSEHPLPQPPSAGSLSVTRVQTVADPVERHRSFELVDRVTGATLPRTSVAPAAMKRTSPPHHRHQTARDTQPVRTSPQSVETSSPALQQHQKLNGSAQCQQDQQTLPTSSTSSLCVEQQCSAGDGQRSSPQTVWYAR